MIGYAADTLRNSTQSPDRTAEIFVESRPPIRGDDGGTVFGCEDEVIEQAGVSRGHGGRLLAPCRGAGFCRDAIRRCRCAQSPATSWDASGIGTADGTGRIGTRRVVWIRRCRFGQPPATGGVTSGIGPRDGETGGGWLAETGRVLKVMGTTRLKTRSCSAACSELHNRCRERDSLSFSAISMGGHYVSAAGEAIRVLVTLTRRNRRVPSQARGRRRDISASRRRASRSRAACRRC